MTSPSRLYPIRMPTDSGGGGIDPTTLLAKAQNLADVPNKGTARTNLALGTAATSAATAFATPTDITSARDRATHTGTQAASTISDFIPSVDDRIVTARGAANGVAPLGADSKVPALNLPSSSGGVGAPYVTISGGDVHLAGDTGTDGVHIDAGYLTVGSGIVASTGRIRLPNNQFIVARDAANTADGQVIGVDSGNRVLVGSSAMEVRITGNTANGIEVWVGALVKLKIRQTEILFSDPYNIQLGTSTGTRIGTATTQKMSFWNATPVVQNAGWSATAGYTALKSFNPATATLDDAMRVIATLVDTLKTYGLLGA